ncbi:MAG: flagellar biosynthesis anti-sigma factor FlgM [Thermodesulfobacteriota bacterium]
MKVGADKLFLELNAYLRGVNEKSKEVESTGGAKGTSGDTVDISSESKEIGLAREIIDDTPDIDQEKVERIKAGIKDGTYNVSGEQVAESLLKHSLIDILL